MNKKNRKNRRFIIRLVRHIFLSCKGKYVNAINYIVHFKNSRRLVFFSIFAATIAVILLITYGIVNLENYKRTPLINSKTVSTQSTATPNHQPSIVSSSSISSSHLQTPPIVPDWAKKSSNFQLPVHQSVWDSSRGISYHPDNKPLLQPSNKLTSVITKIITLIKKRKLSDKNLSITLIDATTGEIAGYYKDKLMFPASIAKMFWLVTLQGQIEANMWKNPVAFDPFINRMMKESDNDSSSFILDNITGSYSSNEQVADKILEAWLKNRKFRINEYFKAAQYNPNINLTQKTYPIPYLKLSEPKGNELQIRSNPSNPSQPIRNSLSSFDAARLMYEICYRKQAISEAASIKMCSLLERQVDKKEWSKIKPDDFNPIQSFFGESLPSKNIKFYSKAGWTPKSRSEVCMVEMIDQKKSYILAVFADDPAFGKDKTIFPAISKLVYNERMSEQLGETTNFPAG